MVVRRGLFSKMLSFLTLFVWAAASIVLLCTSCFAMIGPGLYNVHHIRKCEGNEDQYLFTCDIARRKYNRTHDAFDSTIHFKKIFDHSYSIIVEICKYVDGGCKLYHVLEDADMIHFMTEYAEQNVKKFLELAGIDPPEFPIQAGIITVNNFIYDYEELPDYGLYGMYEAHTTARDSNGTVVGCIQMAVEFAEQEDDVLKLNE